MEMNKQSPSENCNGRQLRSRAKPTTSSVVYDLVLKTRTIIFIFLHKLQDGENFLTDTTALSDSEDDVPLSLRRTRDVSTSSLDSFKSLVPDDPVNEEPQVQATTSSHRRPCPGENQEAFTSISSAETQSDSEDDILLSLRLRRSSKGSQRDSLPGSSCGTKSTPTSRQSRRSRRRSPVEVDYEEDGDTESGSSSSHPSSGWSTERRSSLPRHCKTTSRMRLRNLSEEDDISRRLRPRTPRKENANSRYPLRSHAAKKSDQSLGRHQMPIQSQDRKAYFDPKLESPLKVCLKRSTFPVECSSYGGDRVGSDVEDDAPLSDRRRARRNSTNSSSGPVKVQIDGHWFLLHQASDNPLVWKATEMNDSAI